MVTNVIFRMGAAAMLLSSHAKRWGGVAKYRLQYNERVCIAASDDAFNVRGASEQKLGRGGSEESRSNQQIGRQLPAPEDWNKIMKS